MKYFLVLAGGYYYPSSRTGDWQKSFETLEEAQDYVRELKGNDWSEIVDLRDWIGNENSI